jgi:hypothetical protein
MAIKKYLATKDNTITNAFKANMSTRGVSGNMGQSDVLETFFIYAQADASSSELARILVQFDSDAIATDRTDGNIPASGSVSFFLRLYNAEHVGTTPKDFTLIASAVSGTWDEGLGLDMENYSDKDSSNWIYASDSKIRASASFLIRDYDNVGENIQLTGTNKYRFEAAAADDYGDDKFAIGATDSACATNIKNIIINNASTDFSASVKDDVVTIYAVPANDAGNSGSLSSSLSEWVEVTGSDYVTNGLLSASFKGGSDYTLWANEGGDFYDDASSSFTQTFDTGFENLEMDVTPLVEQWISSSANSGTPGVAERTNHGFRISLSGSSGTGTNSYYTKKFFARGSQFFFKRPTIEARWDSSKKDDRGNFYLSSSLVPASDNLMKLYLYNVVRGQLTDIPGLDSNSLLVSLYSGTLDNTAPSGSKIGLAIGGGTTAALDINTTASYVETGVYSCSFAYTSSAITTIFDVWHSGSTATEYHTGSSISIDTFDSQDFNFDQRYVSKITNLRPSYSTNEVARFRLFTRQKDWNPTIYTVAKNDVDISIVDNIYYKIVRANDNWIAVDFGTGSTNHTRLSYDVSGSYFDFDMGILEVNSVYQIYFSYLINGSYVEQPEVFRFKTT